MNTAYIFIGFLLVLLNFSFNLFYFFFYSSMAGCYLSIFDFLFLCSLWGAWLQYKTDAQQGKKTSFKLLLIQNVIGCFYVIVQDVRPTDACFSNVPLTCLAIKLSVHTQHS